MERESTKWQVQNSSHPSIRASIYHGTIHWPSCLVFADDEQREREWIERQEGNGKVSDGA